MKLSELSTGEIGIIAKVSGHGGFRKRLVEMGFTKGTTIKVVLNAPLRDPIEYELMGYKISLRREEAALVEVVSKEEAEKTSLQSRSAGLNALTPSDEDRAEIEKRMKNLAEKEGHTITIALVGNPNCGKTSFFNLASGRKEHVGNYAGVTVDSKEAIFTYQHSKSKESYTIKLIDLPGTYSLSVYSPEERFVRHQLINQPPDVVINVVDATNLERNLYLTTQLLDINLRLVVALNMFDEFKSSKAQLDIEQLSVLLGTPMEPTISRIGDGIFNVIERAIDVYEGLSPIARHIHVNHGATIEHSINRIKRSIQKNAQIRHKYSTRYLSIKLLEGDNEYNSFIDTLPNHDEVVSTRYEEQLRIQQELGTSAEEALIDAKYGFIRGALRETYTKPRTQSKASTLRDRIDAIVAHKWLGFPLFFLLLYLMFESTFTLAEYPMSWIESIVEHISAYINFAMPDGPLKDMIVDGALAGVGSVIVFLPSILILYLFMSLLEDSGYMARAAFITDKLMHHIGLHGKSMIPLIMGFGCNVPAVMATRMIEHPRSRLVTMLILPFMSCSARMPVYLLFVSAFFPEHGSLILLGLYALGIIVAIILSRILSQWLTLPTDIPFVMELPPYRIPTLRSVWRHTWEKGKQYLRKMGGLILSFSIVIWALNYFSPADLANEDTPDRKSYLEYLGHAITPIFAPMDYDWQMSVGIISGVGAKELVVSTLGVLYTDADFDETDATHTALLTQNLTTHIAPASALSYMVFILLYLPCIATIAAISNESRSWKWGAFSTLLSLIVAYTLAWATYAVAC